MPSEGVAKQAHDIYRAMLIRARDAHGLSYLQPGRFVRPGALADAPYLWFAPLDIADGVDRFAAASLSIAFNPADRPSKNVPALLNKSHGNPTQAG